MNAAGGGLLICAAPLRSAELPREPFAVNALHRTQPPRDPPPTGELALALGLLFGGTGALAVVALLWPPISGWLQVLLAGLLLWIPGRVLRRAGLTVDDVGVSMGTWPRTLGLAGATMAVIFPLFVLGFHLLQTRLLDAEPSWSLSALERWDETLEDPPPEVCDGAGAEVTAWIAGHGLWILPPSGGELTVTLDVAAAGARRARCEGDRPRTSGPLPDTDGAYRPLPGYGVWIPLSDRRTFAARVDLDDRPAPLRVGRFAGGGDDDGRLSGSRSLWWLASFLVVHLGLVALPEEWFFRGYLQSRLDDRFGTPVRLLGAHVGVGVVLAAAAFALLHPILLPGIDRLLVFFPALLFGWLRARGGNIGAAVVVHAGSNLLLAMIGRMYV